MNFSEFDLSILGEIGNVSVGGAATSLSDFVNKIVTISIPDTKIITFKELREKFGPAVIFAKIDYCNGLTGSNVLLLKKEEAVDFTKIIVREKLGEEITQWDDFSKNVLAEMFNIMVGNMSASMSDIFNQNVKINTPEIYDVDASDVKFYKDTDLLVTVWFELRIESEFKINMVKIISKEQADNMVNLIKGDHQL